MKYVAALGPVDEGPIDPTALDLLTDAQLARLALWSIQLGQSVRDLLAFARFMAEQESETLPTVRLIGKLPHCGLYGCLASDGSCHT